MTRFYGLVLAVALLLPAAAVAAPGARLPVATKTLAVTTRGLEAKIQYPQTGNRNIDAVLLAYARQAMDTDKGYASTRQADQPAYTFDTTFTIERNDAKGFAVVFTEYSDAGGAHPNSDTKTFNFLMPDGALILLPEIVDGARGIARVSQLALADLIKRIGTGANATSDKDSIESGAGPYADNFKHFVLLPDRLHIYFPAYQVASYAAGPQDTTIPLSALRDVLRADWRAAAASFDCAKAASAIEKAICADPALARLDRQVAETYQVQLRDSYDPGGKEKLKQSQRDWVAARNRACGGPAPGVCLAKFYRDRLAVLNKPPV